MNDAAIYEASAAHLHATVGYSEMRKRDSAFMWFLYAVSFMWIWNRRFMDGFHTTIFGRIYWADDEDGSTTTRRDWRVLWHECGHRKQAQRVGEPAFSISYLFPQVIGMAAFALLIVTIPLAIFWNPVVLWSLLGLATLGPWPAPWRVHYEREAYLVTAICDALRGWDIVGDWYVDYQVENHCGWAYWKPAWGRTRVRSWVRADIARALRIVRGEETTPYTDELIRIVRAAA